MKNGYFILIFATYIYFYDSIIGLLVHVHGKLPYFTLLPVSLYTA
jgi:hypothetical protein